MVSPVVSPVASLAINLATSAAGKGTEGTEGTGGKGGGGSQTRARPTTPTGRRGARPSADGSGRLLADGGWYNPWGHGSAYQRPIAFPGRPLCNYFRTSTSWRV